jgi:iron(III) transport system permease protein
MIGFIAKSKRIAEYMNRFVVPLSLLILLPIFGLGLPIFAPSLVGGNELAPTGTLSHLWQYVLASYIGSTIILLLGVGIGVILLGVGNAWIIASYEFPGKKIFEWALTLPLAVPTYVMAYLFVDLLQFSGPVQTSLRSLLGTNALWFFPDPRSLSGAIWSFSFCLYPYVYLITRTAFLERSQRLIEVAQTLGYSPLQGFMKVVLPLARPAIFAGMALALMEVLADFGAVSYF